MLIDLIKDIDRSDITMEVLEVLATKYGLFNMTVVLMKIQKLDAKNGDRLLLYFDETTYRETVATFLAMAVMNFASAKHEHFSIRVNSDLAAELSRSYSIDEHIDIAMGYLAQAKEIIGRYEPRKD